MFFVYTLVSEKDGDHYVGQTNDIDERVRRHNAGSVPATVDRRPLKLLTYVAVENRQKALKLEKYFKSGSGKAFINKHFK